MSKKTEFQNWSEIHQVEGNRFRRFEKVLEEGWHAHSLDCATFADSLTSHARNSRSNSATSTANS